MTGQSVIGVFDGTDWGHMGNWGWTGMMIGWVLVTVVVALVAWMIINGTRSTSRHAAQDILDERYARGELSRDEYRERKEDLKR